MRTIARSLAGAIVGTVLLGSPATAQTAGRCTHETMTVDGAPVVTTLCVPGVRASHVVVSETFSRGAQSVTRSLELDVVPGADVTRAVDNVPLNEIGSPKELHLTIAYRNGAATVEHALLLPGAVVLK